MNHERSLYTTEFEIKLRNELTQKATSRECADCIRKKVRLKSNVTNENMIGFINVDDKNYMLINGFTTVGDKFYIKECYVIWICKEFLIPL